ncbi:sigma factor [Nocardioides litoris]|uniref:sigma factor n=1 Tax=Nocardioides litoris TaxID=1926648 RepID=UPI001B87C5BB|nr:sigma factor [Nocardioides litoris]
MARGHDGELRAFAASALAPLRSTGYLLCGDRHRAEDAAQEALVRLYQAWPRIERREGLLAHARRTTVRILVDESRRAWHRRERGGDPAAQRRTAPWSPSPCCCGSGAGEPRPRRSDDAARRRAPEADVPVVRR